MHIILPNNSGTAATARRGRPRRQYRCIHCAKIFKRSEHCIRHERTHTNEKPFSCRHCHKSYSRKDLVTRHERTLHPNPDETSTRMVGETSPGDNEHEKGNDIDGDVNTSNETEQNTVNGYSDTSIVALETSPSVLLQSGNSPADNPREATSHSPQSHRDTDSVSSITTSSTASRHLERSYTGQIGNMPFLEPDMDIIFDINSPTRIDSLIPDCAENINIVDAANGKDPPAGSFGQEHLPSQLDAVTTDDPRPVTQHQSSLPLSSYMDLDLSNFMYTASPSRDMISFHQGENGVGLDSLPHGIGQFQFPSPLSLGLESVTNDRHPTAAHPDIPLLAVDAPRDRQDATDNFGGGRVSQATVTTPCTTITDTPTLIRDGRRSFPSFIIDGIVYTSIKNDLTRRLGVGYPQMTTDNEIPSSRLCADFFASYISNFHGHLPIIHLPTFSPGTHPSPLFLIMCGIGALYRMDRKRARHLYDISRKAMDNTDLSTEPNQASLVEGYPLWFVQTRVLLTFFAVMSGDPELTMAVVRENGIYTIVYHEARIGLQERQRDDDKLSWQSWVTIESWKRLLGSILMCSTMIMVVYNQNPGMNSTMDLEFDALDDEKLWSAKTSAEWHQQYTQTQSCDGQDWQDKPRIMKGVLTDIMTDTRPSKPAPGYEVSAFSGLILMHAVVVHMWQRAQVLQAVTGHAPSPRADSSTDGSLSDILMINSLQTLARCQAFLDGARYATGDETPKPLTEEDGEDCQNEKDVEREASMVFNSHAILRIAHARLFRPDSIHSSIDLANLHGKRTDASIDLFVSSTMERGTFVLKAVEKAFEGLREPIRIGHLFVRKTAAFRWSVEQAVAGYDCALLVSKFVHAIEMDAIDNIEPTADERIFFDKVRDVLREAEADVNSSFSIAAAVAKTWGWLLRDVWVWGITPLMGVALDQVGEAYKRALALKTQNSKGLLQG